MDDEQEQDQPYEGSPLEAMDIIRRIDQKLGEGWTRKLADCLRPQPTMKLEKFVSTGD